MLREGHLITSPYGTIQEANEVAACMLGVARPLLAGQPLSQFVADYARRAFRQDLRLLRHRDGPQHWVLRLQPQQGAPFDASVRVTAFQDRDGNLAGLCWQFCDRAVVKRDWSADRSFDLETN